MDKTTKPTQTQKPEFNKALQSEERKDIPEINTFKGVPHDVSERVIHLLAEGAVIKGRIGKKPDHKKGQDGTGLLADLDKITEELTLIQLRYQLDGLRYGRFAFVSTMQDGRATLNKEKLKQELIAQLSGVVKKGTDVIEIVNQCFETATKTGDPFLVRELEILDE